MAGERNSGWPGFFRVFAVFAALMLLLAQSGQELVPISSGDWQVLSIYEGLTHWSVPALFMVWGMYALEGGSKSALGGTLLPLALPAFCMLVFWGALYAVVSHLLGGGALTLGGVWSALVSAAQGNTYFHLWILYPLIGRWGWTRDWRMWAYTNHRCKLVSPWPADTRAAQGNTYFHLWILYPLIGLYLVHPLLQRFASSASRGEILYILGLAFLFASVLPLWAAFHPNQVLTALLERFQVHMVLGYMGYYLAGWYLRHFTIGRIPEFLIYILGILGMVLTLAGPSLIGGGRELWYSYTAPGVALTAAALCTLFRYVLGMSEERSRRRAVYSLGECVFGVYLFHQIWVLVFRWLGVSPLALGAVASVPVFALVYFLLSLPFAWLFSHVPGVGRWLAD